MKNDSNLLDQICQIDNSPDEKEIEELDKISDELFELLSFHPEKFNAWQFDFIEDMNYRDKIGLSPKQKEKLYELKERFLE